MSWYPIEPVPYTEPRPADWLVVSLVFGLLALA